jgi:hypothetical protein
MASVDVERSWAYECAELAGCDAPQQVHLKETILRVQKSRRDGEITSRVRCDGRNAESVARDRDGVVERG